MAAGEGPVGDKSAFHSTPKKANKQRKLARTPDNDSYAAPAWFMGHNEQRSMDQDPELNGVLSFLVKQIDAEATRLGKPLTEEERFLLNNLPTAPLFPLTGPSDPEFPPLPVPRDLAYERLIALAKGARRHDIRVDSMGDRPWTYAATVCKLSKHPMSWLLRWSGIREQTPWWDRSLLILSTSLLAFCFVAMIFLGILETWTRLGWIAGGLGFFVVALLLYFGSRHVEEWQLRREAKKYRLAWPDWPSQLS